MRNHEAGKQWPSITISKHRKEAPGSVAQRQKRKTELHEPGGARKDLAGSLISFGNCNGRND